MTKALFRDDSYLTNCDATVMSVNDRGGIILDQTVFYPTGGGQPGDRGRLVTSDGTIIEIATTVKGTTQDEVVHVPAEGQPVPAPGTSVRAEIDWEQRHKYMRMHTAMHLMCSAVPCGVTGGQVGADKSRLDFDIGDTTLDKEAIEAEINTRIRENHPVSSQWVSDAELDANPDLVRTMSVQPPRGSGEVRLMKIGNDVDLQPCGGTHVKETGEIGPIRIAKIENKGKRNRRINIVFAD